VTTLTGERAAKYLDEARELLPIVKRNAEAAESQGHMTDELVEAFRATKFRRMMILEEHGGGGLRIPDLLPVSQLLTSADGATGWSLTFAMMGSMFAQMLPKSSYDEIFSDPNGAMAGAMAPSAVFGDATEGGYRVSGKTSYNSAHRFATHMFVGGMVRRDGQVGIVNGMPEIRGFVLPKSEVTIVPNWKASAMIATESDDLVVEDKLVREEFTYHFLTARSPWRGGAESAIPLLSMLGPGLASMAVGAARGAIDAFREMAVSKIPAGGMTRLADQPGAQIALAEAEGIWMAAQAVLHNGVAEAWRIGDGGSFAVEDMARLRLAGVTATRLSRRAAELVRDFSGMSAIMRGNPIERFCRDLDAVTQHVAVGPGRFEPTGRVLMGLPPGSPLV
jgi:alkylation response protein AidB-like acyl-CoA dehydrogenase